jgi:hypothetical protein
MVPFVSGLADVERAQELLVQAAAALAAEGVAR